MLIAPEPQPAMLFARFCQCLLPRPPVPQLTRQPSGTHYLTSGPLHVLSLEVQPSPGLPTPSLANPFECSADERERIDQMRSRLLAFVAERGMRHWRVLTEQRLLRYVRYIDDPADECERMMLLREQLSMDTIRARVADGAAYPSERQMARVWQHNLFGKRIVGSDDRPVFIATIGGLSCTRVLFQTVSPTEVAAYLRHCLEELNQIISAMSEAQRRLLSWTYVLDLSGFSLWQALGSELSRSFFKRLGEEVNRLAVPHQIARVLLVNAPAQWHIVWKAAGLLLPPRVQRKVRMCSDISELLDYVGQAQLPVRYGGSCPDEQAFVTRTFGHDRRS
jgi:hypothetical protein